MITEMNVVSENAKQVIEILTTNMPNVFGAVGIKEYTNKYGEISNVSVNVGTNFPKKKAGEILMQFKLFIIKRVQFTFTVHLKLKKLL